MRGAVLMALAAVLLAGCSSPVTGKGGVSSARGSASSAPVPSASAPSASSPSVPPASAKAGPSDTPTVPTKEVGDDFSAVTYAVPSGFSAATGYGEAVPLESQATTYFLVPDGGEGGTDLISIIVYTLPKAGLADTHAEEAARVDYYNKKLRATLPNGIKPTTLAGLTAFQENVVQPPDYHYATWFAFGPQHLLQLSCQVNDKAKATVIAKGCEAVYRSLRVS